MSEEQTEMPLTSLFHFKRKSTMTGLTLPAALSGALPTISFPLGPTSCPPMYYESLEKMKPIRESSEISAPLDAKIVELRDALPKLFPKPPFASSFDVPAASGFPGENEECRQFGLVAMALLFLGHGLTDEAHDLVTPLSWPEDTHFGYGPSIYSYVTPAAQAYATYVHALVHRREGFNVGEFGMTGFSNANYWSNAMLESTGFYSLPHSSIIQQIKQLGYECIGSPGVKDWCRDNDLFELTDDSFLNARAINSLCSDVLKGENDGLRSFAEGVVEIEMRILLAHALYFAGYDFKTSEVLPWAPKSVTSEVPVNNNVAAPVPVLPEPTAAQVEAPPAFSMEVDEMAALAAARRVYPALMNKFQSDGKVMIRSVLKQQNPIPMSAAAGIACRLLESPACRPGPPELTMGEKGIRILLPATPEEAATIPREATQSRRSLAAGDLFASKKLDDAKFAPPFYTFVPCQPSDPRACYVDKSYGTRGESTFG